MDTYNDNWCSCLLFRNKQLTKELKRFEDVSALSTSSSQLLALSQLLRLHVAPPYGVLKTDYEWQHLFAALLFNITSRSVLKAKQRIKAKLSLSGEDCFDEYIQQH